MFVFICSPFLLVSYRNGEKKKIKCSFSSCEFVFHFSLWLKLSIFFRLVLFSLKMYNRSGKKLIGKNCRQFFKDVLSVTLLLEEGGGEGAVPILRKNCRPFPRFPFINTSSQMKIFIYFTYPFLLQLPPPTALLINHMYSWKSELMHTGIDITCFFKMQNLR